MFLFHLKSSLSSQDHLATSKTWTRTLDLDSEKPGPRKSWIQKNLNP